MRAFVCTSYGAPEVLQATERSQPEPGENQLLVRVHATAVNSGDCRIRRADPFAVRLIFGWKKPRREVLGTVFSGTVIEVGKQVSRFQPGDEIYGSTGMNFGAYAEFLCLSDAAIVDLKPENITHEEAATIPFGGLTAMHFINQLPLKPGERILINGASGAVGSAMLQLAVDLGARVTAMCSVRNTNLVASLGSHDVVNYDSTDFATHVGTYDYIIDTVNKLPLRQSLQKLNPNGRLVLSAASFGEMIRTVYHKLLGRRIHIGVCKETQSNLEKLSELVKTGRYTPVIDQIMNFEQLPEAHAYTDRGHKAGNIAIRLGTYC